MLPSKKIRMESVLHMLLYDILLKINLESHLTYFRSKNNEDENWQYSKL